MGENALLAAVFITFCLFLVIIEKIDNDRNQELAANGLQQCLENNAILWKKECNK